MAKFYGTIGYAITNEIRPGVWKECIIKRKYYGELIRSSRQLQSRDKLIDDISITNQISIISDSFANENFYAMRYVEYMGARWKITNVEVQYPRLILSTGGIYNGEQD